MCSWTTSFVLVCVAWLASRDLVSSSLLLPYQAGTLFAQITKDLAPYAAGITADMVNNVFCNTTEAGFRVQVRDRQVFIAGEISGFQSRNRNIKLALLEVVCQLRGVPDVDLIIATGDLSAADHGHAGPIFAQVFRTVSRQLMLVPAGSCVCPANIQLLLPWCSLNAKRLEHTAAVLFPDHTFVDWHEADTVGWQHQHYIMQQSSMRTPWPKKVPKLLFRGSSKTGNRTIASSFKATDMVDVKVWDWVRKSGQQQFVGLPKHCKNKYLLNWPGNSYSARLKYLLLCGSVVVHSDNGWFEFYYPMLKHGQHFMRTKAIDNLDDITNGLTSLVQSLRSNPTQSRLIAEAGQRFATDVLSLQNIREYWHRLLTAYSELQTFKVNLHPDAIPIGVSLSDPQYVDKRRNGC
ncbi:TPA: hypothetical protein ACH3X1_009163 [Trebouxia sp. C0004]